MLFQGIPHGSRARAALFEKDSIQKKRTAYPQIGQKKLNAAGSRMMLNFMTIYSKKIADEHPCDENRLVFFFKTKNLKCWCMSLIPPYILSTCMYPVGGFGSVLQHWAASAISLQEMDEDFYQSRMCELFNVNIWDIVKTTIVTWKKSCISKLFLQIYACALWLY